MFIERIFKYPTGAEIPKGAVYLNTVTQTREYNQYADEKDVDRGYIRCWHVWHYFKVLVEIKDEDKT